MVVVGEVQPTRPMFPYSWAGAILILGLAGGRPDVLGAAPFPETLNPATGSPCCHVSEHVVQWAGPGAGPGLLFGL